MRQSAVLFVAASSALIFTFALPGQERAGARDMFFGGLEAAAPATARKPPTPAAARPSAAAKAPVQRVVVAKAPPPPPPPPATSGNSGNSRVPVINAALSPLGLRYSILKVNGAESTEVPPSTQFKSGDRIQLKIQTNSDGYLYIVSQGSSGAWDVRFPSKSKNAGSNQMKAGEEYTSMFRFDSKPGVEKLFVVLSRRPEQDLDKFIYELKGTDTAAPSPNKEPMMLASNLSVGNPLVSRLRNSYTRDLVLEEVAAPEREERAIYVVNKSLGPDARVVADIKLIHE